MAPPPPLTAAITLLLLVGPAFSALPSTYFIANSVLKTTKGEFKPNINMTYNNGPILSSDITVHLIWYGAWNETQKCIIRDFIRSISPKNKSAEPSVASWWKTVRLYDDNKGNNVTDTVRLGNETDDKGYSHGKNFTRDTLRLLAQSKIDRNATEPLPVTRGSVYLLLTSEDVVFDEFCRATCGFHDRLTAGKKKLPYAWIGNSAKHCPGNCAFPFAEVNIPGVKNSTVYKPPNGDAGADGMVIVLGHELVDMATNPFGKAWYAGEANFPNEIAHLCEGIYGTGGGGSYPGQMLIDNKTNAAYNVKGINGREFLAPWLYDRYLEKCYGPNALKS